MSSDVADEGRPRRHDLVAGIERREREVADHGVGAGGGDHVRRIDAVPLGERVAEMEGAAVGIAVQPCALRSIASSAAGNGPHGPSFEASLTTRSSPSSRCSSSSGFPARTEPGRRGPRGTAPRPASFRTAGWLVARALAAPEPQHTADGGEAGCDRTLVRALRALDRARHCLLRLVLHHGLRADPGQPAENGVPPVEDAHARTLPTPSQVCALGATPPLIRRATNVNEPRETTHAASGVLARIGICSAGPD